MDRGGIGIGFDLDHTLAIDNRLERVAFLRLLEEIERDGGRGCGNLDEEIALIDELLAWQRKGACSIDDAVLRFATDRGAEANPSYVESFRRMAVEMVDDFVIPIPGVQQLLDGLSGRGIVVAVLSNGWNPLQINKAQRAGFEGPVLASADIGQQKPSAHAFDALLSALGTRLQNTWYVGDDPHSDVDGSRSAGFHAVWFDWEKKTFPHELAPPPFVIRSLAELLEILPVQEEVR
ncbi:MAG TPA: HAD family hydrolase [Candidatus Baltobacteraceae bacterium]|jgi:HAD superfamily hydrolase (TIGR01509 family)|nr:HAD family hydrolase [Candidatus Baltobacteraceae bacterium]